MVVPSREGSKPAPDTTKVAQDAAMSGPEPSTTLKTSVPSAATSGPGPSNNSKIKMPRISPYATIDQKLKNERRQKNAEWIELARKEPPPTPPSQGTLMKNQEDPLYGYDFDSNNRLRNPLGHSVSGGWNHH